MRCQVPVRTRKRRRSRASVKGSGLAAGTLDDDVLLALQNITNDMLNSSKLEDFPYQFNHTILYPTNQSTRVNIKRKVQKQNSKLWNEFIPQSTIDALLNAVPLRPARIYEIHVLDQGNNTLESRFTAHTDKFQDGTSVGRSLIVDVGNDAKLVVFCVTR